MKQFLHTLFFVCVATLCYDTNAQTTLISPTGDGGFESGPAFTDNGWTDIEGGANVNWFIGNAAGVQAGSNAAFLGGSATSTTYTGAARIQHIYKDVAIPSGATNIKLQFYLKMPTIDNGNDAIYVFNTTTSNTPVAGTQPGAGYTQIMTNTATTYASYTLMGPYTLSNSLAGTTVRLVFTFKANNANPRAYAAVDNISFTYCPTASASAAVSSTSLCTGATLSLTGSVSGATSYSWSGPNSYSSTAQNPAAFTVGTASSGVYTITGTSGTCSYTAVTPSVTVSSGTPITVTANCSPNPVCEGSSVSLTATAPGATTFSWSGPNSYSATVLNPPAFTTSTLSAGVYTLTVSAGGCQSSGSTPSLVVRAAPGAITGSTAIWTSSTITLSNSAPSGTWSSSAPSILSVNSSTGAITSNTSTGSATITYNNGCGSPATSSITVFASTPITGTTTMCYLNPALAPYQSWESGVPTSSGSPVSGWSYTGTSNYWAQQLASTSSGSSCSPAPAGSYVAMFLSNTLAAGSTAALISPSFSLVGSSNPYISFSFFRETAAPAKNDSVQVYINTSPSVGGTLIATVMRSASLSSATVGTESVTGWYTYTFNLPTAYFGATNYIIFSATGRGGNNIYLDNISIVNPVTTTTLSNTTGSGTWSSSNTSIASVNASTGEVSPISTGSAVISYTTSFGMVTSGVTVNSMPTLSGVSAGPSSVCAGAAITLAAGSTSGTGSIVSYNWAGPDSYAETTASSTNSYTTSSSAATGPYSLTVTYAGAGCTTGIKTSSAITVTDGPSSITGNSALCPGSSTTLSTSPSGGTWSSSDPTIATVEAATGIVHSVAVGTTNISYTHTCGVVSEPFYVITSPAPITGTTNICGTSVVTILSESWESGVPTTTGVPVDGWSYLQGTGANDGDWLQGQVSGSSSPAVTTIPDGSKFANFNSFTVTNNKSASLVSPAFSLSGVSGATVSFWVYRDATSYPTKRDSLSLFINTSASLSGARYLKSVCRYYTLTTSTTGAESAGGWYQYSVTIPSSYNGSTNYLIFLGTSHYGNNLYMDKVTVKYTPFTTLTETTPGGTWSSSNTGVAVVSSTGIVSSVSAGTANISYTTPCGAVGTTVTVSVLPTVASITPSSTSLCAGSAFTLTAGAVTGPGSITSYNWSGPNGFLDTTVAGTDGFTPSDSLATGIYTLSVTYPGAFCTSNPVMTSTVTVRQAPTTILGNTTICPSSSTTLTSDASGGTWSTSDPSVATIAPSSGILTSTGLGTANITYTQSCGVISTPVTVTSTPDPITGTNTLCYTSTSFIPVEGWESGVPVVQGTPVDSWNYLKGTGNANNYWVQQAAPGGSNPALTTAPDGSKVARFKSYSISNTGNSAILASPSFSLSGFTGAFVTFYMYRDNGYSTSADSISIYVNTSMTMTGATRLGNICRSTSLATPTAGTAPSNGWYQYTLNIPSAFSGATNYILFKGTSQYGNDMYLDAISVKYASTTTLVETTAGGTWSSNNTGVADIDATGKLVANGLGTATISYTTPCGYATMDVSVNSVPSISGLTTSSSTLCLGTPLTLTAGTLTGAGTPTYNWSGPNGYSTSGSSATATLTPTNTAASGIYRLYVVRPGIGCISSQVSAPSVTVNNLPSVTTITPSQTSICAGQSLVLASGSVSGTGSVSAYNWSGPAGYSTTTASPLATLNPANSSSTGAYSLSVTYPGDGCTSSSVASSTVNVYDYPQSYTVTGGNACSAATLSVGTSGSDNTASYMLRRLPATTVETISGSGSGITFTPVNVAGAYAVIATGPGGCQTTMSGNDTVFATPGLSLAALPDICEGLTAVPMGYSTSAGTPANYSIDWDATANSAGFNDVVNASLPGSIINVSVPVSGAYGTFNAVVTASDAHCTSAPYAKTITVYQTPVMSVTGTTVPCVQRAGAIDFSGTDGATVSYSVDGGSTNHFTFSGTTYSLSTGNISSQHSYIITSAGNPVCATSYHDTITIDPIRMAWLGGASGHETEWNYAGNWTCGFEPTDIDDVTINASAYTPAVPVAGSGTVRNLAMTTGAAMNIGSSAVLNVKGDINNAGTVAGSGRMVLNNSAAQTVRGIGTISNVELDNTAGATIDTGARLMISKALYLTHGTLTTNDSLELLSGDTNAAARIATIPATGAAISGRVQVDQYVQGGYRRYRFWSHAFSDTMSLGQIQKYIDITGIGGAGNGFTTTATNAPSCWRFDPYVSDDLQGYDPGWAAFTRINALASDINMLHPGQGIRLFFRGAKGEGLGYSGYWGLYTPSPVVVKTVGHVNQGDVQVTLAQGSSSPDHQSYNMIGNPYPSPVDLGTVVYNAVQAGQVTGAAFYLWNPAIGAGGQYMAIPIGVGAPAPYYVQANTAFEVKAEHDGAVITFTENDKAASTDINLFKTPAKAVRLNVYDSKYHLWDVLSLQFSDKASDKEDKLLDATKPNGSDFNFYSLSAEGNRLAIDSRPFEENKVIPLGLSSTYQQEFIIRAESMVVPQGGTVTLHDKLLDKYTELKTGTEYRFTIDKDKNTQGNERFELSLKPAATTVKGLDITMTPNPTSDEVKISFTSGSSDNMNLRIMDISGVAICSQDLGAKNTGVITVPMSNVAAGVYMVEITQGGNKVTRRLVKE